MKFEGPVAGSGLEVLNLFHSFRSLRDLRQAGLGCFQGAERAAPFSDRKRCRTGQHLPGFDPQFRAQRSFQRIVRNSAVAHFCGLHQDARAMAASPFFGISPRRRRGSCSTKKKSATVCTSRSSFIRS